MRKGAGVREVATLPLIRVVVLDYTKVNHFDATASLKLRDSLAQLEKYAGQQVEVRLVALSPHIK